MKICFIDLETTGLDPHLHEIIEFGCYIFDSQTLELHATYEFKIKPQHIESADPVALGINGYNGEEWRGAVSLEEFKGWFKAKLAGYTFCSFPVLFDYGFIENAGLGEVFMRHKLDLFTLAWARSGGRILKLRDYCMVFGVEPEGNVHRAINGARCGYELFKKMMI